MSVPQLVHPADVGVELSHDRSPGSRHRAVGDAGVVAPPSGPVLPGSVHRCADREGAGRVCGAYKAVISRSARRRRVLARAGHLGRFPEGSKAWAQALSAAQPGPGGVAVRVLRRAAVWAMRSRGLAGHDGADVQSPAAPGPGLRSHGDRKAMAAALKPVYTARDGDPAPALCSSPTPRWAGSTRPRPGWGTRVGPVHPVLGVRPGTEEGPVHDKRHRVLQPGDAQVPLDTDLVPERRCVVKTLWLAIVDAEASARSRLSRLVSPPVSGRACRG